MKTTYQGALYLSVAAAIWGGLYVASKYALEVVPPFTLLLLRYLLASVVLIGWCRHTGVAIIPRTEKWALFQVGFIGYFLSIAAQFIGTKYSSAHMGAVITTLSPVFQSGFAVVLLGEKMTVKQVGSIVAALIGVFIITGLPEAGGLVTFQAGNLFFLAAALFWGYYSVLVKKVTVNHSVLQVTTWGIIVATILTIIPVLTEIKTWNWTEMQNPLVIFSIFYVAIFATAVAFFCWNKGLSMMNPHHAGLFFFLQPVVGSFLGWLLLNETLTSSFFIGSGFILAGAYIACFAKNKATVRKIRDGAFP